MDIPTLLAIAASLFCAVTSWQAARYASNGYLRSLFWLASLTGLYLLYFYVRILFGTTIDTRLWLRPAGAMLSSIIGSFALYEWLRRRP